MELQKSGTPELMAESEATAQGQVERRRYPRIDSLITRIQDVTETVLRHAQDE